MEKALSNNTIISTIDFVNVAKPKEENISKDKEWATSIKDILNV